MKRSTVMNETALTNTHIVWRGLCKGILIVQIHGILNAPTSKTKLYRALPKGLYRLFKKKSEAFEVWHLLRNMMGVYQIQRWQHSDKTTVFSVSKHCPSSPNTANPHWSWLNLQTWWWCLLTWHVCRLTLMFNDESLYILSSSVEGPCFMPTFPFRTHLYWHPPWPHGANGLQNAGERIAPKWTVHMWELVESTAVLHIFRGTLDLSSGLVYMNGSSGIAKLNHITSSTFGFMGNLGNASINQLTTGGLTLYVLLHIIYYTHEYLYIYIFYNYIYI